MGAELGAPIFVFGDHRSSSSSSRDELQGDETKSKVTREKAPDGGAKAQKEKKRMDNWIVSGK
jgi:hypothetical protein